MTKNVLPETAPRVGVADPERRNSPVQTDPEQSFELVREQIGDEPGGCYFNDVLYAEGTHVLSSSPYLRCERGVWRMFMRRGAPRPWSRAVCPD
jgi:hypothetical protein